MALNKLKNVRLLTVALGDQDGVEEFNYVGLIPGSSGSQLGHTLSEHGEAFAPAAIELKTTSALAVLCDDCYALRTHSPSLIKIDVDGNELAVLRGMVNIQGGGTYAENAGAARSVQVELHPKDAGEIIVLMNNNGYKLIERHYTASGKKQLEKGADPLSIVHNAVFQQDYHERRERQESTPRREAGQAGAESQGCRRQDRVGQGVAGGARQA